LFKNRDNPVIQVFSIYSLFASFVVDDKQKNIEDRFDAIFKRIDSFEHENSSLRKKVIDLTACLSKYETPRNSRNSPLHPVTSLNNAKQKAFVVLRTKKRLDNPDDRKEQF
jgi:hypothetical protein